MKETEEVMKHANIGHVNKEMILNASFVTSTKILEKTG